MTDKADQTNEMYRTNRKRILFIAFVLILILVIFTIWKSRAVQALLVAKSAPNATISGNSPSRPSGKDNEIVSLPIVNSASIEIDKGLNVSSSVQPEKRSTPEICGLSESEANAFIASKGKSVASSASRGMAETISKLVQSSNLREKTLGLFITTIQASLSAADTERLNTPGCKTDEPCFLKPLEIQMQVRSANAEPLVKLALSTSDASIYAAALYACGSIVTGACASISYVRWAQMEPDNAAAWLMVAGEANSRKDRVALANALQRAASAKGYNEHVLPLASVLTSELVKAQSPLEQSLIAAELKNVSATIGFQKTAGVFSYCVPAGTIENGHSTICEGLATKLVEKDETTSGIHLASKIGEKLGWSAERLQPLIDELDISIGQNFTADINPNKFTCDNLTKSNQELQKSLIAGQRTAMREFVNKSGRSLSEVAAGYRKAMQL